MPQVIARSFLALILLGTLAPLLPSCSSTYDRDIAEARASYYGGNLQLARDLLREKIDASEEGDSYFNCLLLEESMVHLAAGEGEKAEENLLRVRDAFERIEEETTKAALSDMASYFTDDRAKPYPGEDFEKIMIRVMLAFADMLQDGEDVVAYCNQALEKQRDILDQEPPDESGKKFKKDYRRVGIGAYLYGLVTEERDPTAGSEVRISYQRVKDWEPGFPAIDADLDRVDNGVHSRPGNGVVYVFTFVGRGPEKVEVEETDMASAMEIVLQFTRFIPAVREYYGPTLDLSPIRIPVVRRSPGNVIRGILVEVDGEPVGQTETVTDIAGTAVQQYESIRDWVLAKALMRRMVKKAVTTAAKGTARMIAEQQSSSDLAPILIEIGGIIVNTLWSAMERADTRYWAFLPEKIQVLRVELPAGAHTVGLTPEVGGGRGGASRGVNVEVRQGRNTYVFGLFPTPGMGPDPVTTLQPAVQEVSRNVNVQ